jgi:glycerol-3-phosphate acyltransferase PlsY
LYKKGHHRMLELGIKFLLSYILGSIMGSMVLGRIRGGVDIRTMGSGNAGGTNALRTQGILFALGVIIIDVGKGALATAVVPGLEIPGVAAGPEVSRILLTLACAAASVAGHVWPVWHGFRGGKGAATLVGTILVLQPILVLPLLAVWGWVLLLTGYVGLSTMLAGVSAPVYLAIARLPLDQPLFVYCVLMALYLIYSHRSNIARMRAGTENRSGPALLFRRKRQTSDDGSD